MDADTLANPPELLLLSAKLHLFGGNDEKRTELWQSAAERTFSVLRDRERARLAFALERL